MIDILFKCPIEVVQPNVFFIIVVGVLSGFIPKFSYPRIIKLARTFLIFFRYVSFDCLRIML
ncbi:hypothetical protein LMTR13_03160 [Bradyrhizobium icense]|uniref:Uncharacterized protein n=1 Tax=Bradyrhizobium icense TaxID=1274631 RepID=A0A1B1U9C6_9BRAD|nr:hypothetical protein LMTR13_03160 [Bradyrhizobium icense]